MKRLVAELLNGFSKYINEKIGCDAKLVLSDKERKISSKSRKVQATYIANCCLNLSVRVII